MGSKTEVIQPSTPPPVSAGQSAKEYAAALPQILESQLKYQPQFDQQTFDSFAELAPQFAQVYQDVLEQYSPNQTALTEDLAGQFLSGSQQGLPDELKQEYLNTFKANVADPSSPVGASAVAKNLLLEDLAFRQFNQNAGLSYLGRAPVTQAFQNPSQFQVAPSFGQAFGTAQAGQSAFIAGSRPLLGAPGTSAIDNFGKIAGGIGGALSAFSSKELKHDIIPIDNATDKMKQINPVNFKWNESNETDGGVIAEEIEEILPDAVTKINGIKAVKPMMLIGYLIKSVKELSDRVETNEAAV